MRSGAWGLGICAPRVAEAKDLNCELAEMPVPARFVHAPTGPIGPALVAKGDDLFDRTVAALLDASAGKDTLLDAERQARLEAVAGKFYCPC